jgi:hypothetical protein
MAVAARRTDAALAADADGRELELVSLLEAHFAATSR